jgi:hypothetical protein
VKWAVLTIRVPLHPRYPWKVQQAPLAEACAQMAGLACDDIRWLDVVDPARGITTDLKIIEEKPDARPDRQ